MKLKFCFLAISILAMASCSAKEIKNTNDPGFVVSDLKVTGQMENLNRYPCTKPTKADLKKILETGNWVSNEQLHDHYSFTGCSIDGTVNLNGRTTPFKFDFGGIFEFPGLHKTLACGESCCKASFEFCSFDTK